MTLTKEFIHNNLLTSNGTIYSKSLKKHNIINSIEELYCIYFEISEKPKCSYCNKERKFQNFKAGYSNSCGRSCKSSLDKRKKTNIKLYGVENTFQSEEIKDKIKKTNLERYGFENAAQNDDIKRKISNNRDHQKAYQTYVKTCKLKYNTENVGSVKEFILKRNNTNLQKYGHINYFGSKKHYDNMIQLGLYSNEPKEDVDLYYHLVWKITNKQDLHSLQDYNRRGKDFHLDHKFSIIEGYRQNIPPYIIGDIKNLEILPAKENCAKRGLCSIALEELF